MIKLKKDTQSVEVDLQKNFSSHPVWYFSQNGYQYTGVSITPEQFKMLRELITRHEVVEFYENTEVEQ